MLKLEAITGYDVVDFSKENDNYLLLKLTGGVIEEESERSSISVVALLDVSGSMSSETKIGYLKKSVIKLIDNLKPSDRLSIISYSTSANKLLSLVEMNSENKKRAYSIVNKLSTISMTNMSEAMIMGYEEFRNSVVSDGINRIILFTDGCPTAGNCNHSDLVRLAENIPEGIQLTTMGYGTASERGDGNYRGLDLNVSLLQDLANAGKGNYYYMSDPDSCGRAFANELAGLLSVVAQNVKVKITSKHMRIVDVMDDVDATIMNGVANISLIDIMSEETKYILMKIKTEKQKKPWVRPGSIATVDVEYMNSIKGVMETISLNVKLEFKKNGITNTLNSEVETQLAILNAISAQETANQFARNGDFTKARSVINDTVNVFSSIDNDRARNYVAGLSNATSLYENAYSFSSSEGVRSATLNSMRGGRASGGLMDNLYVTSAQQTLQEQFTIDNTNDNVNTPPKLSDVINDGKYVNITHPTFIPDANQQPSITTTNVDSSTLWTSINSDGDIQYSKKSKINRW